MRIKPESAPERIVKQILHEIECGILSPGEKLSNHQKMAKMYGVGRSSIREAINALVVMGYIDSIQGKGTFVTERIDDGVIEQPVANSLFANASIYNLMEIRELLECYAVKKAAQVISEEQIEILTKACEKLERSYHKVHLYLKEDMNFHMEIAKAAKNPDLGDLLRYIHFKVNNKMPVILKTSSTGNLRKAIITAKGVVKYIVDGDAFKAERVMREHLGIVKEAFLRTLLDDIVMKDYSNNE